MDKRAEKLIRKIKKNKRNKTTIDYTISFIAFRCLDELENLRTKGDIFFPHEVLDINEGAKKILIYELQEKDKFKDTTEVFEDYKRAIDEITSIDDRFQEGIIKGCSSNDVYITDLVLHKIYETNIEEKKEINELGSLLLSAAKTYLTAANEVYLNNARIIENNPGLNSYFRSEVEEFFNERVNFDVLAEMPNQKYLGHYISKTKRGIIAVGDEVKEKSITADEELMRMLIYDR